MILKFSMKGGHSRLTKLLLAGPDRGRELCRIIFHLPAVLLFPTTTKSFFHHAITFLENCARELTGPPDNIIYQLL